MKILMLMFLFALSSCFSNSSDIDLFEKPSATQGFAEGSVTTSPTITAKWSNESANQFIDLYSVELFNNMNCTQPFNFSIAVAPTTTEAQITIGGSGNYSYSIKTKFKSGSEKVSPCSSSIKVNLTPAAPTFALFPIPFATGTGNFQFGGGYASGFAVDFNGNYLFGDYANQRIQVINPYTGAYITSFGLGVLGDIQDIEVDPNGNIFAISYGIGQVHKFDKNFNHVLSASVPTPVGLSLDNAGYVYVTSYTSFYVEKFDNNLSDLGAFVSSGLSYPGDSSFDSFGNMWLANTYASTINKYDSTGNLLLSFNSGVWYPRSVHVLHNGKIAVSDASYITYIFEPDGTLISQFTMPGSNPFAPWSSSTIVRIMPDGDMVISYNESGVYKFGKFKQNGIQSMF